MKDIMNLDDLLDSREGIPAWKQSKKMKPEDYQRLESKRFEMELDSINQSYQGEGYYNGLL